VACILGTLIKKALYREERIPEEHLEKLVKMDLNFASGHDIRFDKNMEESYLELKEYFRNQNLTFHE
jgi:hypothetical protein